MFIKSISRSMLLTIHGKKLLLNLKKQRALSRGLAPKSRPRSSAVSMSTDELTQPNNVRASPCIGLAGRDNAVAETVIALFFLTLHGRFQNVLICLFFMQ
ncbi:hypothetical protein CDAR_571591 [Caerostris darwini]|uniref:Uncharacterized protein n=1 Tax=Caerostris darwini TaxID=1538125 RepID=A0AAV4WFT0_9ARAC|nr:hypothetical protein CDAR_571591 [Caerostris darwini]